MNTKKFLFVLAACFLILILHNRIGSYLWPSDDEKPATQTSEAPPKTAPDAEATDFGLTTKVDDQLQPKVDQIARQPQLIQGEDFILVVKDANLLQEETVVLGSRERGSGFKLEARLTTDGASIDQAWLTEFTPDSDKYKYAQSAYDRKTPLSLLNPVAGRFKPKDDQQNLPRCEYSLATSRLRLISPRSQEAGTARQTLATLDTFNWKLAEQDPDLEKSWASFETTLQLKNPDQVEVLAELTLRKTYTLPEDSYDIQVKIELTLSPDSAQGYTIELTQDGPTGMGLESARGDMRAGVYGQKGAKGVEVNAVPYAKIEKEPGAVGTNDPRSGDLLWAGVMNKFFGAYLVPESNFTTAADPEAPEIASVFKLVRMVPILDPKTGKAGNVLARLVAPAIQLEPGQPKVLNLKLFLGPKQRGLLKSGEYGELKFAKTIQAQTMCSWMVFAPLREGLVWLLTGIYSVIPNYGVAIILLVALVRVALHHFTRTSQVSMVRMSKMGPEIEKLKKKLGNNREELGRAQMALYKEHKINPLSGCLPMALQMPIWIALYTALSTTVELRHAPFFWWINNLSGPDNITAYFAGGLPAEPLTTLPMLGAIWGLNLLPIFLGVAFFLQQKFTPTAGAAATPQAQQTKKMMYFMMALFPLMLYSAPSGLNLYIMTSTFVGVIESHYIKKHIRRQEELQNQPVAGSTTTTTKIKTLRVKKK